MTAGFTCQFPFGAQRLTNNQTRFSLWAPGVEQVELVMEDCEPVTMTGDNSGFYTCVAKAEAGCAYSYRVAGGRLVPDPASRAQKDDVHGPSLVMDPLAYQWLHPNWSGRPWGEMVIYELHVGSYGGFSAVAEHLPELAELGITAVELMPIADFAGSRNWGYDGVLPFAPARAYGTPEELKRLIDDAHGLGLCVYLDVVYNHFGPEGNYLHSYAPDFFDEKLESPWGAGIDFGQKPVRDFFAFNAIYWLMEYRFDGLRLDAVHAISDSTWLDEAAARIRQACEEGRHVHLMLENERNISSHLEGGFEAQWNDDIHNVIHVLLTGEGEGYYANYQRDSIGMLARALREGFIYQGEGAPASNYEPRGTPSAHLPPWRFIFFLQNHDQTGNRAFGERLATMVPRDTLKAVVALQLLCPQIPLLFMGEERGATAPFLYFTDFSGDLATAVREGRKKEFADFSQFTDVPDPNAAETFERSAAAITESDHETLAFYQHLLKLRRERVAPHLTGAVSQESTVTGAASVVASWRLGNGQMLRIGINFGDVADSVIALKGEPVFESASGAGRHAAAGQLAPRSCSVFIEGQPAPSSDPFSDPLDESVSKSSFGTDR